MDKPGRGMRNRTRIGLDGRTKSRVEEMVAPAAARRRDNWHAAHEVFDAGRHHAFLLERHKPTRTIDGRTS
jgi:hypothetical protein